MENFTAPVNAWASMPHASNGNVTANVTANKKANTKANMSPSKPQSPPKSLSPPKNLSPSKTQLPSSKTPPTSQTRPSFALNQPVWYARNGTRRAAVITAVNRAITPPSYSVRFENNGTVRNTKATFLQKRVPARRGTPGDWIVFKDGISEATVKTAVDVLKQMYSRAPQGAVGLQRYMWQNAPRTGPVVLPMWPIAPVPKTTPGATVTRSPPVPFPQFMYDPFFNIVRTKTNGDCFFDAVGKGTGARNAFRADLRGAVANALCRRRAMDDVERRIMRFGEEAYISWAIDKEEFCANPLQCGTYANMAAVTTAAMVLKRRIVVYRRHMATTNTGIIAGHLVLYKDTAFPVWGGPANVYADKDPILLKHENEHFELLRPI